MNDDRAFLTNKYVLVSPNDSSSIFFMYIFLLSTTVVCLNK